MAQHVLEDLQEQYVQAVYRFREAEAGKSDDYCEAKREMNRLEHRVLKARFSIYTNNALDLVTRENMLSSKPFIQYP